MSDTPETNEATKWAGSFGHLEDVVPADKSEELERRLHLANEALRLKSEEAREWRELAEHLKTFTDAGYYHRATLQFDELKSKYPNAGEDTEG